MFHWETISELLAPSLDSVWPFSRRSVISPWDGCALAPVYPPASASAVSHLCAFWNLLFLTSPRPSILAPLRASTQRSPLQYLTVAPSKTPLRAHCPRFSPYPVSIFSSFIYFSVSMRVCSPAFSSAVSHRCAFESPFLAHRHNFQAMTCFSLLPIHALSCICEGATVRRSLYFAVCSFNGRVLKLFLFFLALATIAYLSLHRFLYCCFSSDHW